MLLWCGGNITKGGRSCFILCCWVRMRRSQLTLANSLYLFDL